MKQSKISIILEFSHILLIYLASQSSPIHKNKSSVITRIMSVLFNAVSLLPRKMLANSRISTNTSCCLFFFLSFNFIFPNKKANSGPSFIK